MAPRYLKLIIANWANVYFVEKKNQIKLKSPICGEKYITFKSALYPQGHFHAEIKARGGNLLY